MFEQKIDDLDMGCDGTGCVLQGHPLEIHQGKARS